jgi:hypothetical protein
VQRVSRLVVTRTEVWIVAALERLFGRRDRSLSVRQLLARRVCVLAAMASITGGLCWAFEGGWIAFFVGTSSVAALIVVDLAEFGLVGLRANPDVLTVRQRAESKRRAKSKRPEVQHHSR